MRFLVAAVLGVLLALPASAQQISPMTGTTAQTPQVTPAPNAAPAATRTPATRQTMQQRFEAANTSKDGRLTLAQAQAAKMTRVAKNFDGIDTAKKGYVTMDDIRAFNRAQRAAAKAAK